MEGDKKTGVTIMEMTKKLDAGKIYGIKEYEILDTDNASILFEKLSIIGRDLLLELFEDIISGKNIGIEQDDKIATFSKNIDKEEEKIDINDTSINIRNKIRGLAYDPGAYLEIDGIRLKIFDVKIVENNSNNKPGTILQTKKEIIIKTKDSAISLESVLYPGKRIMTGKEFSNGQKIFKDGEII